MPRPDDTSLLLDVLRPSLFYRLLIDVDKTQRPAARKSRNREYSGYPADFRAYYQGRSRLVDLGLDATCYRGVERLTYLQNMAGCHFDLRLQKIKQTQSHHVQH